MLVCTQIKTKAKTRKMWYVMLLHDSPIQQPSTTSKFSPCTIKPWRCKISGSIVPCILTLALFRGMWPASCFGPCSPTKTATITNQWETKWTPEPVWTLWRQKNFLLLTGTEPWYSGHPACRTVTLLNYLSWLHMQENSHWMWHKPMPS
jgi:hypothetical protein